MKGLEESHSSTTGVAAAMKRRAVSSLSPAKERHLLARIPSHNCSSQLRPPLTRGSGNKTKSSNLAAGSRPPTKPPPLPRNSIAVSQEETCLVSASGDVLVSRSREFSQLMLTNSYQQIGSLSPSSSNLKNSGSVGWCDMECSDLPINLEKSALCNPWMTRLTSQREEKKDDDSHSEATAAHYARSGGLRGGSTYEWEARTADPVEQANRALGDLELEVVHSASNVSSQPASPLRDDHPFEGDDEDRVLSMPSFDYSHFGNGGNDMLPTSPIRNRPRRHMDAAEIDVNVGLKLPENTLHTEREPSSETSVRAPPHKARTGAITLPAPPLFHGVPTFLTSLLQVRIQQVSAHPRGSHVLMISAEALLFSYGLNDHGQLGIGIKSEGTKPGNRYVWTPTIITPLLENGGKAIACAAGESHSLVVVSTEGRRVLKSKSPKADGSNHNGTPLIQMSRVSSSPPTIDTNREQRGDESEHSTSTASAAAESVWHHQLYGFGRNNFMKIGLVHPRRKASVEQPLSPTMSPPKSGSNLATDCHHDDMDDVLLPHRVALHCTVWPEKSSQEEKQKNIFCGGAGMCKLPPQGIFALAASSEHSAALVRRATGDIELYTWGNAAYHALGLPQEKVSILKANKISPVPTLVEELSYTCKQEGLKPTNLLLDSDPPEFPVDVSLGPYSTFVVTSKGRCFSFGISYDGMLGHGRNVTEVKEPRAIQFPGTNHVTAVSAGTGHVMALANCGTVFTWGKNTDGRLGLGDQHVSKAGADATDLERTIEWTPQELPPPAKMTTVNPMPPKSSGSRVAPTTPDADYGPVVQVCAGLDCSIFVTSCGQVLSCGKHSGRLGLGEAETDVHAPAPLFGGLRLWYRPVARPPSRKASPSPAKNRPNRPVLKRGMTLPG